MLFVRARIQRWVSCEPQPGLVEVTVTDANSKRWTFVDKAVYFSSEELVADSGYPRDGVVACIEIGRRIDTHGREVVRISTDRPWDIETVDEVSEFEVDASQLLDEDRRPADLGPCG